MAVKLIPVKCPECGATLNIEEGREQAFCTYCGTKVLLRNENEYIYRHVDEASVKQAETDQMVRLKEMELAEKMQADAEKTKAMKIRIALIVMPLGVVMFIIGAIIGHFYGSKDPVSESIAMVGLFLVIGPIFLFVKWENGDENEPLDKIKVPSSISNYKKKNYSVIETAFVAAGFTNVKCIALNDLTVGVLKKPGLVESITINGEKITSGGARFPKDAVVVITYHSLGENTYLKQYIKPKND